MGGPQFSINTVSYTVTGDTFEAKKPQVWPAKIARGGGPMMLAGLSADGKRVLMIVPIEQPKPPVEPPKPVHIVVFLENFFDYLNDRVPVGR